MELNTLYEPPDIGLFFRYGNTIRTYFVAVFFSYILPTGPLLCMIYLILQYWVDKYFITKDTRKPSTSAESFL